MSTTQPKQKEQPETIDPVLCFEIQRAFNFWWQRNKPAYPYNGPIDKTEIYIIFRDGYRAAKNG